MRRPTITAALLAILTAASNVHAANWLTSSPGDAFSTWANKPATVAGPFTFDGCNPVIVGGIVTSQQANTYNGYNYTSNQVWRSDGLGQWTQLSSLTQFSINSYTTEWVQDPSTGTLYVWGPSVVNTDVPLIPLAQDYGYGTSNDSINGAGQLWSTSDGIKWTQLLAAGNAYNKGTANCLFKGSIYSFGSTSSQYLDSNAVSYATQDPDQHLRFTPGNDTAWVEVSNRLSGLPERPFISSCAVTDDGETLMLLVSKLFAYDSAGKADVPANVTDSIYISTDGLTFHSRATPWTPLFTSRLVPVGADVLLIGGQKYPSNGSTGEDSFADTFSTSTWSTSDAGQTWTELTSAFGDSVYYPSSIFVANENVYASLIHADGSAQVDGYNYIDGYVLGTLGTSFDYNVASCQIKVAAANAARLNGTLQTNTPSRVQNAGTAYQPAMYATALVAAVAAMLL